VRKRHRDGGFMTICAGTSRYWRLRFAVRIALAGATAGHLAIVYGQEMQAQSANSPSLETIEITGTRLPTPIDVSISPLNSVSAFQIEQTGLTRVEDILNTLPMVTASMNATVSNFQDGTAAVNLRGLGNQRTLVLVDGLRLGPGSPDGRNWSDLNQVPIALIERIDVLTGSASAVYGADAVAGVVNFIINSHFDGVKVDAGYHINQHFNRNQDGVDNLLTAAGDPLPSSNVFTGAGENASVIIGANLPEHKGNATAYLTYDNQTATLQNRFDYSACTLEPTPSDSPPYTGIACSGSEVTRGGEFAAFSTSTSAVLLDRTVDPKSGIFRPFVAPNDLYNYGPANFYLVPNERWTTGGFANYDLTPHLNVYANLMYMRNSTVAQIAPSGDFFEPSFVACANPLLTPQEVSVLCTPADLAANGGNYETYNGQSYSGLNVFIGRRNVEGGARISTFLNESTRGTVGIKGDFLNGWTYNVHAQRDTVDINDANDNNLGNFQIEQALNVLPGPHGPVCGGPTSVVAPALVATGTPFVPNPHCVPWNIWVPNGVTPAAVAFMTIPEQTTGDVTEQVVSGSVTGDLGRYGAALPWAQQGLQVNVGAEWREERSAYWPDLAEQQGNVGGAGAPIRPVAGEFTTRELFSEFRLPIATNEAFAHNLSLEGGYRDSRYSQGFQTSTYKIGLQWAPTSDIRLRGSYQRAVRAPNIAEIFAPDILNGNGTVDPCAGTPTASRAACALSGVKPGQYGNILPSPFQSYNDVEGGNIKLKPEAANTTTLGVVLTPRAVPELELSVDYFRIAITDVMGAIGADTILLDCLASVGDAAERTRFCPLIHRDSEGTLWLSPTGYISNLTVNEGELLTAGVDISASYHLLIRGAGSLLFTLTGTDVRSLRTTPVSGFGSFNCVGYFGPTCEVSPRWRHVANTTWFTPWTRLEFNLRWRFNGAVESEQTSASPFLTGFPYLPLSHIPAYNYFDLSAKIDLLKEVKLELGVNNIADKAPPLVVGGDCGLTAYCNGNTLPGSYDALGRYFFARVSARL
jgi:iron complex outermembrane receptor protein